ncbi:7580_t:CDS:10, partial [Scutellospora calospora]
VAEEYFGAVLGRPLPAYQDYNPNLTPGVDTFFSTVTFRYGHSELSDFYQIRDEYGDTLYNLALSDIKNLTLLEQFGLERVLWSMVLQRQEEVDIFMSDSTKKVISFDNYTLDLAAFDLLRSRDRAQSFADISTNSNIQENLAKIYPNGVDSIEAWVGVMSEDHLNGSNFGNVLNASMVTQYVNLRDSDKFWFERPDMFNSDEQKIIRNTTLRDIIIRNINKNVKFPQNIWAVQPRMILNNDDDDKYPNKISIWAQYIISHRVDLTYVYFKVQLQTFNGNGWFGMGFSPDDDGMRGAEFIIGTVTDGNVTLENYHADVGGYHPPLRDSDQDPTLEPRFSMSDTKAVTVEFRRPLNPPGRKPIIHGDMKLSYFQYQFLLFGTARIHRYLQVMGGISASAFCAAVMSTVVITRTPHAWAGLVIYTLSLTELVLGFITLWGQEAVVSVNKRFICAKNEVVEQNILMNPHINHKEYDKLPEFTWEEINGRVQCGAYLVVCDGFVVDICDWYHSHPGGNQVLLNAIGTDITNDFYNTHKEAKFGEVDSLEDLLIQKVEPSGVSSSMLTTYINYLRGKPTLPKPSTIARFIDNMNIKHYFKEPLAQHPHSRFATQKMASMVIGKVNEKEQLTQNNDDTLFAIQEKNEISSGSVEISEIFTNISISIKFHLYKLTSKEMVNANANYPVMKFTFSNVHHDKDISNQKFLPGHYVELQARIKGQIVIRSYTPVEGSLSRSFSIYVKIYPNGLFSQHLVRYEIQVRGPFNVCDRLRLDSTSATLLTPADSSILRTSHTSPTRIFSPIETSLLNQNSSDGCWDELYMIAGGTGITPMLQSMKRNRDSKQKIRYKRMYLLFGNRNIEDIIDGTLLEYLELSSKGQLTVTYCLSDPPSDWTGLQGKIDQQLLQDWMNIIRGVLLPTTQQNEVKSQITPDDNNYASIRSNSIRYNVNEQNQSSSSEISTSPLLSDIQHFTTEPKSKQTNLSKWSNLVQGKIIICGPYNMINTVEKSLFDMGYDEQDMIILY